jgi:dihydrofolate reductase
MPKYVVSNSLEDPEWQNTTVLNGDAVAEIAKLKEQIDGVILVAGSAKLLKTLLDADLVDELRLMVFPVVLGKGKRLFRDHTAKNPLELVEVRPVGSDGVVLQVYQRAA